MQNYLFFIFYLAVKQYLRSGERSTLMSIICTCKLKPGLD